MSQKVYNSELGLQNKLGRLLWGIVYVLLFRLSPRTMHRWRILLLRLFGAQVSASAKIYSSVRIWAPWNLSVGDAAIVGDRVDCYSVAPIKIGAGAVVSQDSCLCAATHDHRSGNFELIPKPVTVEAGAWVAARAFIGPGVTVSQGAVVGACAVVFKDVAEGTVVVGNPAQEVKRS